MQDNGAEKILIINPGSTSTKIGWFSDGEMKFVENISHSSEEIQGFNRIVDQKDFRKEVILNTINDKGFDINQLSGVVGRGGLLRSIPSGTYLVNETMLADLEQGLQGEHASNLGGLISYEIAQPLGIPSFIVDPVVVDEMDEVARLSGLPIIPRRSIFHALNHKAVARTVAEKNFNMKYEDMNFIVAHLGGGISIAAHRKGKVVDVNNALNGDGPFAPERAGGLPVWDFVGVALSGKYTRDELKKMLTGKGGVVAYLGTNNIKEVQERIEKGDKEAETVLDAMVYQISKEIGALSTVFEGNVDAIILTGGVAHNNYLVNEVKRRVAFITDVIVFPGEDEMDALAHGALRVLRGKEEAKKY